MPIDMREALTSGGALRFGYLLSGEINAKKSYGGYSGFKEYRFMFYDGELVSVYGEQEVPGSSYLGNLF